MRKADIRAREHINGLIASTARHRTEASAWSFDSASSASSLVANNIFAGNGASTGGGIDHTLFFGTIRNNDFHDNTGGDLYDAGGSGASLIDNIFVDPEFTAPSVNNYRLRSTSPCIDAADDASAPLNDLDMFVRPYDGDGDLTPVSDIGAYEHPGGTVSGLVFVGPESMNWEPLSLAGSYNLCRGSLARLKATGEYTQDPASELAAERFCSISLAQTPFVDSYVPGPGEAAIYLVTFSMGAWESSPGADSAGRIRPNDHPCIP